MSISSFSKEPCAANIPRTEDGSVGSMCWMERRVSIKAPFDNSHDIRSFISVSLESDTDVIADDTADAGAWRRSSAVWSSEPSDAGAWLNFRSDVTVVFVLSSE